MRLPRRRFLQLASGAIALPALSCVAQAQAWPSRPITLVVPYPAGGRARGDGYTLSIGPWGSQVVNGAVYTLPFDQLNDLVPVALIAEGPQLAAAERTHNLCLPRKEPASLSSH